ncbi:MAG TPA: hypothetical protein VFG11_03910, partial [Acidobacteriota bacterium]|nr:hypothetical protein [Acidobacteriota bacterium]
MATHRPNFCRSISIVFLFLLCLFSCRGKEEAHKAKAAVPSRPTPYEAKIPVLNVPPDQMREAVAASYRLAPDHRVLRAVEIIMEVLSGSAEKGKATATYQNGAWTVRYKDTTVGTLPPLFDLTDGMDLLINWSKKVAEKSPVKDGGSDVRSGQEFYFDQQFKSLENLNSQWKQNPHNSKLFAPAAHALTYVMLQTVDDLEQSDNLAARALAMTALGKAFSKQPATSDEAVLAYSLDYTAYADTMAQKLPASDAVRLFIAH